ncbi:MAG: hypothetical protein Q9196_004632, partial [Gyalolechia fulgens]
MAHPKVVETRDTVHPKSVTEMLTGILPAVGQPLDVRRVYKHTRDILWKDVFKPRRRSTLWLFSPRGTAETSMMRNDDKEPHVRYKSFMLFFMSHVLQDALEASLPRDTLFLMTAKISCRALKLGAVDGTAWLQCVENDNGGCPTRTVSQMEVPEKHPDALGTQENWLPSPMPFLHDTGLTLSRLRRTWRKWQRGPRHPQPTATLRPAQLYVAPSLS